jgi:uncharacterized protein YegP (UPF0339 family)
MRFHLFRSPRNRQYYFRIVAGNGRTVAQSEGYKRARSRDDTVAAIKGGNFTIVHHGFLIK